MPADRCRPRLLALNRFAERSAARGSIGLGRPSQDMIDGGIVERRLAPQQIAPGFDRCLGFLDIFEKCLFAVKAAPAPGLEQFGEIFQPLLGESAPARDDVAAARHVYIDVS